MEPTQHPNADVGLTIIKVRENLMIVNYSKNEISTQTFIKNQIQYFPTQFSTFDHKSKKKSVKQSPKFKYKKSYPDLMKFHPRSS